MLLKQQAAKMKSSRCNLLDVTVVYTTGILKRVQNMNQTHDIQYE